MERRDRKDAGVKKKYEPVADVSHWYGIDASRLGPETFSGLWLNLNRVQAQRKIHSGDYDPVDFDGVYELFLMATGDRNVANRARVESLKLFVDSKREAGGKHGQQ